MTLQHACSRIVPLIDIGVIICFSTLLENLLWRRICFMINLWRLQSLLPRFVHLTIQSSVN